MQFSCIQEYRHCTFHCFGIHLTARRTSETRNFTSESLMPCQKVPLVVRLQEASKGFCWALNFKAREIQPAFGHCNEFAKSRKLNSGATDITGGDARTSLACLANGFRLWSSCVLNVVYCLPTLQYHIQKALDFHRLMNISATWTHWKCGDQERPVVEAVMQLGKEKVVRDETRLSVPLGDVGEAETRRTDRPRVDLILGRRLVALKLLQLLLQG